ncbi:Trm112 family protein [Candidatus Woesearchaeota archaeon]|nr:Trm112 family protein [Candidatus Woesearchaeota archaeon]
MPEEVMEIMTCPVCKAKLKVTEDGKHVKCTQCGTKYPIEDGIPVIMPPKK